MPSRPARGGAAVLALVAFLGASRSVGGQQAGCTPGCAPTREELEAATRRMAALEQEFEGSTNRLIVSLAAVTEDREAVQAAVSGMAAALGQWDEAIRALESPAPAPRAPDHHIALGRAYAERHRLDDALREFDEAVRQDPQRADAHTWVGLTYAAVGKPAEAAQSFLKASALEPDNPATYYQLARQQMKAGQPQQMRDTLRTFRERLARQLARPGARHAVSAPFAQLGVFSMPAGASPTFPPASYAPGFALVARGAYDEAIAWFRQTTGRENLTAGSSGDREPLAAGRAAMRQGDMKSSLKYFEDAAAAADRSEAHRMLAAVYAADGQYGRSTDQFKAAIRADPSDERAWASLADVLATTGQFDQVEHLLKDAIQSVPNSGQLHFSLGRLYESLARYADAARSLEAAVATGPMAGEDALYAMIGGQYVTLAAFDRAAEAWMMRIDLDPNNADAHRRLGEAHLRQDRDDDALAEFLCALWIDPRSAEAQGAVARLHLRSGRYAEAAEAATQALQLDPALRQARYVLGAALMRLGRAQEATRQFDEFQRLEAEATALATRQHDLERLKRDASVSLAGADYEKTAAALREAVTLESDSAPTHLALGFALLEAGHYDEAIASLQNASRLGAIPEVHRYLAEAYKAAGRLDESRSEYETYQRAIQRLKSQRLMEMSQPHQ